MDTLESVNFYKNHNQTTVWFRILQVETTNDCLKDFNFDNIECIETGASQTLDGFGIYLSHLVINNNGKMSTVDINQEFINNSVNLISNILPISDFNISHYTSDSISFLENYTGFPNLVHLDSFDLDLKNPIPSMLHCWLEFVAIKDKMPIGSIIIIDDNFLKNSYVTWNYPHNGTSEIINIDYDMIGKGSLIYHWCKKPETEWNIIGNHYQAGLNFKLIIQKS